jgi:hypothetical protein
MRQIVIDELRNEERKKAEEYLARTTAPGPMTGIYWLRLPQDLLSEIQGQHAECAPFYFAIESREGAISFELLVRSQTTLHCSCIGYATRAQRNFLLEYMDQLLTAEGIRA